MLNIVINTSNLKQGGALQVALSFIEEAREYSDAHFHVILGKATGAIIDRSRYLETSNLSFHKVDLHPSDGIFTIFAFRKRLRQIEAIIQPDGVITVFGPCYWQPRVPHIMGFANGYYLYEDTYFFRVWSGWKKLRYRLKKAYHRLLLRKEASMYWVETVDSRNRLSTFVGCAPEVITVASNNCSNFFRQPIASASVSLPPKRGLRLVYISSYYPHKGFELIPKVLDILNDRGIEVEIIVTLENEDYLRVFDRNYSNVINLGRVNPAFCPSVYESADIAFTPTLLETFTAIYPEAMYMQKPIVTTQLPFAKDICGEAALYFDPSSAEDAADKIMQIAQNEILRDQLIQKGCEQVQLFDLPAIRFDKIFNKLKAKIAQH